MDGNCGRSKFRRARVVRLNHKALSYRRTCVCGCRRSEDSAECRTTADPDALFQEVISSGQFYKMTADELRSYYHVANAVWYKDGKVLGYSFDRRGRNGYGANAKSPVLLSVEGDTVKFAGCLGPQT